MRSLRLWILLFGVVSFAGGAAAGRLVTLRGIEPDTEASRFGGYLEFFAQEYELGEPGRDLFAQLLQRYEEELAEAERVHLLQSRAELKSKLQSIGEKYETIIREDVIPPNRLEEYDLLVAGRSTR